MRSSYHHIAFVKKASLPVFLLAALFIFSLRGKAQTPPSAINQVKAVFLYNFTQFVSWPPDAFPGSNSPFVIGIVGQNPFSTYLEKVVDGETVSGRPIEIRYYSNVTEIKHCQILFINNLNYRDVLRELAGKPVLTVGDRENFARSGGMIGFYLDKNKIRFSINQKQAKATNITISSKLLRLAQVVEE